MPTTLAIELDRGSPEPLYRQIEVHLRSAIADGRLRPGALLPGVRTLAGQLGVARITIVTAYEQLVAEGLLEARVGSGTRVTLDAADAVGPEPRDWPAPAAPRYPLRPPEPVPGTIRAIGRSIDLRPGGIPIDDAPAAAWEAHLRSAWRDLASAGSGRRRDEDPAGDPVLRAAIAERVGATRGIRCTPAEVVITAGRRTALAGLADLLLGPGSLAVVEDPADPRAQAVLDGTGARIVPVPVDARGLRTELLPPVAALARVTPSWQESVGGTLSLDRRLDLLAWAERSGATVVEDDPCGEVRLHGSNVPALRSLDTAGIVVFVCGLDELLFEGLQLGCVIAPAPLAARLAARLDLLGRAPGTLEQRAMASLLREGHVDRHLRRLRQRLGERQAALVDAVNGVAHGFLRAAPAPAGRHLVVTMVDPSISARTAAARAASAGVLVEPLAAHRRQGGADRELLVGYSTEPPERIHEGIRRLAETLASRTSPGTLRVAGQGRPSAGDGRRDLDAGPIIPRLVVALE